ncbi:predicted protein [Streptomyces iranensis]|uniref:Uncharacterized protein n=1 Tax=Streptomyces iranensis TaxID=576784 RepID=A0A061AB78_9ACTN|nr:predicted protein [Streptomyces iranensis]
MLIIDPSASPSKGEEAMVMSVMADSPRWLCGITRTASVLLFTLSPLPVIY